MSLFGCCVVGLDGVFEESEELAGDGSFQASFDFASTLSFGSASGSVGAGRGVVLQPGEHDRVQRPVELAIAGAVEPMSGDLPGARRDRGDAGQGGERGLAAQPSAV